MAKSTFSPVWATGGGSKGFWGWLQKKPPHACAGWPGRRAAITPRPSAAAVPNFIVVLVMAWGGTQGACPRQIRVIAPRVAPRSRLHLPGPDADVRIVSCAAMIPDLSNRAGEGSWSVAPMSPGDEAAYARLVATAPASPITHTLAYRDALLALGLG